MEQVMEQSLQNNNNNLGNNNQAKILFIIIALCTFALSQLTGYLVNNNLNINETHVINSVIHLTHVRNHGGIFGSFSGNGMIFSVFSIILLSALCAYLFIKKDIKLYEYICFGFIVGAGASNVAGRFIYGSVIDYINIQGIPYWHYVFNTADTFIHIGAWPMIFFTFLEGNPENKTN